MNETDADGRVVGSRVETVATAAFDGDESPVRLTVLDVRDATLDELTLADARACGFRTRAALIADWKSQHPRTPYVRLVRFMVGDLRDAPRLLSASLARRNYTASPRLAADGEPEALSKEQLAAITTAARQRDLARQAEREAAVAAQPLAIRLAAIEAAGERMRLDFRRELQVIRERLDRAQSVV